MKKIRTSDGTVLSYYCEPNKLSKLHNLSGPAVKYPKALMKENIYAIFGREMKKEEWGMLKKMNTVQVPIFSRL